MPESTGRGMNPPGRYCPFYPEGVTRNLKVLPGVGCRVSGVGKN
ncbi:hypothetical protein [Coleofasciculus sp. E2-BRE-01]